MTNRALRIALVVLALVAQGAATFLVYQAERQTVAAREGLRALIGETGRAQVLLADLRSAQTGLVASGQDQSFWGGKVAALVQDAAAALKKIDRAALAPEAAQDLNAAAEALASFDRAGLRVKELLAAEQPLTASALVFGDAAQFLASAVGALAGVPVAQADAVERGVIRARRVELIAIGAAAGVTLLVLLLLAPLARATVIKEPPATASVLGLSLATPSTDELNALGRSGFDLDIPRPDPVAQAAPPVEPPRESEEQIVADLQRESQLRLGTEAQVDLPEAARLCGDLAKVGDAAELPALLARATDLVDGAGIVVWIAGVGGSVLRPALNHGYSDHTMAKMKAIPSDAENAVSAVYRTGRAEVVRGTKGRNGAVVTPINTANGCVGAMAVELRHGAEASPGVQAVLTIIAAQLATLVAESASA
jgi:hypothetical protein